VVMDLLGREVLAQPGEAGRRVSDDGDVGVVALVAAAAVGDRRERDLVRHSVNVCPPASRATGCYNSVMDSPQPVDEQFRRAVVEARSEFFERQFGPLPGEVQKLLNLTNIWNGGLYQMAAPRLGGLGVCLTHGLTDADMPARVR